MNMISQSVPSPDPDFCGHDPAESLRVEARNVSKHYGQGATAVTALSDVSLAMRRGKMVVLLGPSGCGKTTLLRCIAGLEEPQSGQIWIEGREVYAAARKLSLPPEQRHVGMVFQSYALWPHMSAAENIAYPLRNRGDDSAQVRRRVGELLDAVGLSGMGERRPGQLSGGQQQRVALARAIAADNQVVLFDEPLSNVDAKVRDQIRREIIKLQREMGFAGLYVTHDQIEAGAIADTLVIMDHGRIAQVGTPMEVYDRPMTRYVANFMGPSNEVTGAIRGRGPNGTTIVQSDWGEMAGTLVSGAMVEGGTADILFRPENAVLSRDPLEGPNTLSCTVLKHVFMGAAIEIWLRAELGGRAVEFYVSAPKHRFDDATRLHVQIPPAALWIFAR